MSHKIMAGFAIGVLLAACGGEEDVRTSVQTPPATEEALPQGDPATGLPSGEMRRVEVSDEKIAQGADLFARNCVACHAEEGNGRLGIGPALNSTSFLAAASDDFLFRTIYRGRSGTTMPPWGAVLGRDGIEAVIAYMRSWSDVEPAELDDSPTEGDAEEGAEVFRQICAACHGASGAGYQETSNGTAIGRAAFLSEVSNGYLRYLIEHGKTNTPMRPFGRPEATAVANLTDEQIENVIAYLRANAW